MSTQPKQIANPSNQAEFQAGMMDGTRFRADRHTELEERYTRGTSSYRMGFGASADHPRAIDPDYAS